MNVRAASKSDLEFLKEMLLEAFFWDKSVTPLSLDLVSGNPEFTKLLADWGRKGDRAVIGEQDGMDIGAAWFRLWTAELHSYGFVEANTPEAGLAVRASHREQGIGRKLLKALVQTARSDGFPALSLSVSPRNHALRLYESEGFRKVGESGTSWTLLLRLSGG